MKFSLCSFLFASLFLTSCYPTQSAVQPQTSSPPATSSMPQLVLLADVNHDGNFVPLDLEAEDQPQPVQGQSAWMRAFYSSIRYPAAARERGIGGTVLLDVEVDETGRVVHVGIKQSVSRECDEEAKRAYTQSIQQGYTPLLVGNIPTRFKMELPVMFGMR